MDWQEGLQHRLHYLRGEILKIILEFNDDEVKRAEQAYRGADYAMAAEDFRMYLRNAIKHGDHDEKTNALLTNIQSEFHNIFEGLLDD